MSAGSGFVAFVRYGIPGVLLVAGTVVLLLPGGPEYEFSAGLTGAGLSVLLLNVLHRIGVEGDSDRDREDAARRYFDEHGRWPGE